MGAFGPEKSWPALAGRQTTAEMHRNGQKPHRNVRIGHREAKTATLTGFVVTADQFCICSALMRRGIGANPGATTICMYHVVIVTTDCMIFSSYNRYAITTTEGREHLAESSV